MTVLPFIDRRVAPSSLWQDDRRVSDVAPAYQDYTEVLDGLPRTADSESRVKLNDIEVIDKSLPTDLNGYRLAEDYLTIRKEFVEAMGWRPGQNSDQDRYDQDPRTLYFIRSKQDEVPFPNRSGRRLIAGLRLTEVMKYSESLSWEMLTDRPDMREQLVRDHPDTMARLDGKAGKDGLWDLTRLVTPLDGSVSLTETGLGAVELFGAATAITAIKPNKRPLWFFLVTNVFQEFMAKNGYYHEVLLSDVIHPGEEISHFCVMDPQEAYARGATSDQLKLRRAYQVSTKVIKAYCEPADQLD